MLYRSQAVKRLGANDSFPSVSRPTRRRSNASLAFSTNASSSYTRSGTFPLPGSLDEATLSSVLDTNSPQSTLTSRLDTVDAESPKLKSSQVSPTNLYKQETPQAAVVAPPAPSQVRNFDTFPGKVKDRPSPFASQPTPRVFEGSNGDRSKMLLEVLKQQAPPGGLNEIVEVAHGTKKEETQKEEGVVVPVKVESKDAAGSAIAATEVSKFDGVVPSTDIMFGRGTAIYDWAGNVQLRKLVKDRQEEYKKYGETRIGKTAMSREFATYLENEGIYFWDRKRGSKEWYRLDYKKDSKKIREKISSSLRAPYDNTDYYKQKRQRFEMMKKERAAASATCTSSASESGEKEAAAETWYGASNSAPAVSAPEAR